MTWKSKQKQQTKQKMGGSLYSLTPRQRVRTKRTMKPIRSAALATLGSQGCRGSTPGPMCCIVGGTPAMAGRERQRPGPLEHIGPGVSEPQRRKPRHPQAGEGKQHTKTTPAVSFCPAVDNRRTPFRTCFFTESSRRIDGLELVRTPPA